MGLFSRRTRDPATNDINNDHALRHERRNRQPAFDIDSGNFNRRPSFRQWLRFTWVDILTMAAMGAIGLGVYEAKPAPSRSFPVSFSNGEIVYPEFAYPLRHEIVPIWLAALLASLIPIFIILCMQTRIRSFWDANNAIIGLLYSLIGAAVFQVFVKWLIGGLRPHFLSVCDPDPALIAAHSGGSGFQNIMFQRNICRGHVDQIDDSLESMPSGHTTAAFGGFLYLFFYLNAKLKVFSNHHPAFWKLIVTYAPLLGACLIGGALTIDEYHNWYDVFAGAVIGSVFALSSYRMVYASVWDFRFNHIPLTRHTPFSYGAGAAGAGGFESAVFTRQAGWGYEEHYGGAPFDAAHGLRGQAAGFNTGAVHQDRHLNKSDGEVDANAGLRGTSDYNNGTSNYNNGTSNYNNGTSNYNNGTSNYNNGTFDYDNRTSDYNNGMSSSVRASDATMTNGAHNYNRNSLGRKPVPTTV